jgi:putative ABC transport system permease protein
MNALLSRLHPLDRKLFRDLWHIKGQVLAIALVIASGVGLLVMSLSTLVALDETARAYYDRYRFANVFAQVERAPEHLVERIRGIPGVQSVETRVVHRAVVDIPSFDEPVIAQLVSLPDGGEPALNRIFLRAGRMPSQSHPDQAVMSEPFAEAHGLGVGDHLRAIVNGHWRDLEIVGLALSPEYVYALAPGGLMPDDERFGILWLGRKTLEAAYDLEDSFNDVSLALLRGTDEALVIDRLDAILDRYGGVGAYAREDQLSNWFLMNELEQLRTLSRMLPTVFLGVAAFLTNMVLARLIAVERSSIGLLKAFGYRERDIALHYVKLVLVIGTVGVLIGWALGSWLGLYNTRVYAEFYRFPFLLFHPGPKPYAIGAIASLLAALVGTLSAVRDGAALPPAESMRPPSPPLFRRSRLANIDAVSALDQPTRIILRQIARWPGRSFFTSAGIGLAVAVVVTSMQWMDAIDHIVDVYFDQAQVQDVTVGFVHPRASTATLGIDRLPGVMSTEATRTVSAKLRFGSREHRGAVQGVPAVQRLLKVYDASGHAVELPPEGLVLSTMLAQVLGVQRGDLVTVEVLEGRRPVFQAPVADLFETYIGMPAYMEIGALNRMMRERPSVSAVQLEADPAQHPALFRELKRIPEVSSVTIKAAAVQTFHETMAQTLLIFVTFFVGFACTLAFGVTYNAARISLSERGRELATLRVLGFTRAEISYILLGEIGLLTFVALPLGCLFGYGLARALVSAFETELYRIPAWLEASTFGFATLVALVATAFSALLVRRRLDSLDLIAVLKTRE